MSQTEIEHQAIHSQKAFYCCFLILALFKLWLVDAQDFLAPFSPHDDYLFINLAKHILNGSWLGPYNQVTLIKGPVYPLFIAASHHLALPLLLAQQLLYLATCLLTITALRPLYRGKSLYIMLFAFLLFNPFTYDYPGSSHAFRFGISMPLVLALFAAIGALIIRRNHTVFNQFVWSTAIGIIFSLLWYTREEGIWTLPSLLIFSICFIIFGGQRSLKKIVSRVALLLPIPLIFSCFTLTFSELNKRYYGAPTIVELKSAEFQSALGGLMNINVEENPRYVPVSAKNQLAAYDISPTFNILRPYFEKAAKGATFPPSFFIWSLRSMASQSGNTSTLPEALSFYGAIGKEIKKACETGTIPCLKRKASIKPVWKLEYFQFVPATFLDIFRQTITFKNFRVGNYEFTKWNTTAPPEMVEDYRLVTRERLVPGQIHHIKNYPTYYKDMILEKFRLLVDIGFGYKLIVPVLFSMAFLAHLYFCYKSVKTREANSPAILGLVILVGLLSLIAILTYVQITLWSIVRPLTSAYPLVLLYIVTMSVALFSHMSKKIV